MYFCISQCHVQSQCYIQLCIVIVITCYFSIFWQKFNVKEKESPFNSRIKKLMWDKLKVITLLPYTAKHALLRLVIFTTCTSFVYSNNCKEDITQNSTEKDTRKPKRRVSMLTKLILAKGKTALHRRPINIQETGSFIRFREVVTKRGCVLISVNFFFFSPFIMCLY